MKEGLILGSIATIIGAVLYGISALFIDIDIYLMMGTLLGLFVGNFITGWLLKF